MSSPMTPVVTPVSLGSANTSLISAELQSSAPRKFPAPCWTQDETLALINSYQDKWYSLRRRNLRTADWEAVAEEVARRCPDQAPPKTSAQCRHKMEKLRKRYRTEKQRFLSLPNNRFFGSSWIFFDLMDSMELGSGGGGSTSIITPPAANLNNNVNKVVDLDQKQPPPVIVNVKGGGDNDDKGGLGKYFDEMMMMNMGGNGNNKGKSQNHEFAGPAPHIKFKVKSHQQHHHLEHQHGHGGGGVDEEEYEEGGGYNGGGVRGFGSSTGFKRKAVSGYEEYGGGLPKMMPVNGGGSRGRGRGKDAVVGEMVASIKMLGEGLVRMEKMKMDMMRDIEKMRMEMEMKRSEMIMESQHLIVNAFVEGMKKKKKVKVMEVE